MALASLLGLFAPTRGLNGIPPGKGLERIQTVHRKATPRAIAIDEYTLEWLLHIHISPK